MQTAISTIFKGLILLSAIMITACGNGQEDQAEEFSVSANGQDLINEPVYADLEPGRYNDGAVLCLNSDDGVIPAQVESTSDNSQRLWWIANQEADETKTYTIADEEQCYASEFYWESVDDESTRLLLSGQPIIQYEHPVYDTDDVGGTKIAYHHVSSPDGNEMITKGPGGIHPHHRGIFFGYSQVYHENSDNQINIWSSNNGVRSEHAEVIKEYAGPVMGGQIVKIEWKDQDGNPIIEETRELRAYLQPEGESLIDFSSTLNTLDGPITLRGDRQHAGVQFRASQYVADHSDQTEFIRPQQWSQMDPQEELANDDQLHLPWDAMYFKIDDRPYTVAYLSHDSNPDAEMSERTYGRIGEYFPHNLDEDNPLNANYRFWVKVDEKPTANEIDSRHNAYNASPNIQTD